MAAETKRADVAYPALVAVSGALVLLTVYWAFFRAPFEAIMGVSQKIFYFHVPAAFAMYTGAIACLVGSIRYLYEPNDRADALARAGAETAALFGAIALMGGVVWAKPAWGTYWSWEPRILTTLLQLLIYGAYILLRGFAGDTDSERKFAAALGVLGTANLPIIRYSVQKWGGNHPSVVTGKGGGLGHPDMYVAWFLGIAALQALAIVFLWSRSRLHTAGTRLAHAEERALELGLLGDEA